MGHMILMLQWWSDKHCSLDVTKILPGAYRITWNHLHCLCHKPSPFSALSEIFGRQRVFSQKLSVGLGQVKTMLQWNLNSCKMLEIQQYRCILSKPCWKIRKLNTKKGSDLLLTTDGNSVEAGPVLSWNEEAASDCRIDDGSRDSGR